jgi:DNA-binding NarL/FixJ family response regulator
MPLNAAAVQEQPPLGRIAVLGGEAARRQELAEAVRGLGHEVSNRVLELAAASAAGDQWVGIDTILIVADERDTRWAAQAKALHRLPATPPVVVLGPQSGSTWRRRALQAGAFLCASREASAEDLQSILSAAIRYRSLEKEINLLRIECERICLGLLKSYGEAAANLKDTAGEVEVLQRNLSDIRNQIIRAFV